jgi:hypothetical protein
MSELEATAYLLLAFALRCVLPLAVTLFIGYLMNRISNRWEREDAMARAGFSIPVAIHPNCWVTKKCDPAMRNKCPAYLMSNKACWQAKLEVEGRIPKKCSDCPLYIPAFA